MCSTIRSSRFFEQVIVKCILYFDRWRSYCFSLNIFPDFYCWRSLKFRFYVHPSSCFMTCTNIGSTCLGHFLFRILPCAICASSRSLKKRSTNWIYLTVCFLHCCHYSIGPRSGLIAHQWHLSSDRSFLTILSDTLKCFECKCLSHLCFDLVHDSPHF